jgi:hypothetical protein
MSSVIPNQRLRLSIWTPAVALTSELVNAGSRIVDDLTLLETLRSPMASEPIEYESNYSSERTAREIALCHGLHIQVLAGMALTDLKKGPRTEAFEKFLKGASDDAITERAKALIAKMDEPVGNRARKPFETFDGLGFDLENMNDKAAKDPLVKFYRAVAKEITVGKAKRGRFVSVAGAPFSSPDLIVLPETMPRVPDPKNPGKTMPSPKGAGPSGFMPLHPFEMARGLSNLIMRPMCYDTFTVEPPTSKERRAKWHQDILDFAVRKSKQNGGKPPATVRTFQMGFKYFTGTSNTATTGNLDGIVKPPELFEVCAAMRRAGVGVVLFAFPAPIDSRAKVKPKAVYAGELERFWAMIAECNFILNGPWIGGKPDMKRFNRKIPWENTCLPALREFPRQAPLGPDGVTRLTVP